jgi:hypothetical protein
MRTEGHDNVKYVVGFFIALTLLMVSMENLACASRVPTPKKQTEMYLSWYFQSLVVFRDHCGRYPTTSEGLSALYKKPVGLECPSWTESGAVYVSQGFDGWHLPLSYVSDGGNFRIDASHGYFVTDKTPGNESHNHFENPNPPSDWARPPLGIVDWSHLVFIVTGYVVGTASLIFRKRVPSHFPEKKWSFYDNLFLVIGVGSLVISTLAWFVLPPATM